jgi:hypothetical protein
MFVFSGVTIPAFRRHVTVFARKRDEVTEGWKTLNDDECHSLCFSPNAIRKIKSLRLRQRKRRITNEREKMGTKFYKKARRKEATSKT